MVVKTKARKTRKSNLGIPRLKDDPLRQHTKAELDSLEASIKKIGPIGMVYTDQAGFIVDGRQLLRICKKRKLEPYTCKYPFTLSDAERIAVRVALNAERRHLNQKDKRAAIAAALKLEPHLSNSALAQKVGASPKTVEKIREMCHIATPEKTIGKDGKARRKPKARKSEESPPVQSSAARNMAAEPENDQEPQQIESKEVETGVDAIASPPAEPQAEDDCLWAYDFKAITEPLESVPPASVDACFAQLKSFQELADLQRILKPDGCLIAVVEQNPDRQHQNGLLEELERRFGMTGQVAIVRRPPA
jgi:ParB-like chromosome segregation protein Spo0J